MQQMQMPGANILPASTTKAASSRTGDSARLHRLTARRACNQRWQLQASFSHSTRWNALKQKMWSEALFTVRCQDVQYATLLSEMAYRAAECNDEVSWSAAKSLIESEVGCHLPEVQRHRSGGQRYLVGETDNAIYVAFQGTKHVTDWLANLHFIHAPFWHHKQHHSSSHSSSSSYWPLTSRSSSSSRSSARAHVGFIRRANQSALSISALQQSAAATGKRLVLTGHSLGGAVATLTTVRLLRSLHTAQAAHASSSSSGGGEDPQIRCISFATPAVANSDLLQEVAEAGWDKYITNIVLPEDPVVPFVNLLLKAPTQPAAGSSSSSTVGLADLLTDQAANRSHPPQATPATWTSRPLSRSSSTDSLNTDLGCYETPRQPQQQYAYAFQASGAAPWDYNAQPQAYGLNQLQYAQAAAAPFNYGTPGAAATANRDSEELVSWLAAARGAVQQQRLGLHRSISVESSEMRYSSSSNSLYSMQSSTAESASSWNTSSTADSLAAFTARLEAGLYAASAAAGQFLAGSQPNTPTSADPAAPGQRLNRFGFSKARLAVLTGALAAGMRWTAALSAPQLLSQHLSVFATLPRTLSAPFAVAAVHIMGTLWLKSAVPVSHPLGQQLVMTRDGIEQVMKPLKAYPKHAQDLGLQELGGFAPGHRMIAYRRRMVNLIQKEQQ